jgi:hypothetical protein
MAVVGFQKRNAISATSVLNPKRYVKKIAGGKYCNVYLMIGPAMPQINELKIRSK